MLFNSIDFLIFLPIVFTIYWFLLNKHLKLQNAFVWAASYLFYGWWDWRFLGLIFLSTLIDFYAGIKIYESNNITRRKFFLLLSVFVNIGFLGFFKYFNFFVDSFVDAFTLAGVQLNKPTLEIILPVGISFYTFQTLSYTIDIFRKQFKPTKDFVAFAAFVSFFPQLVAGPIERAANLLPQFYQSRKFSFENGREGLRLILWGLFKKLVIADNIAPFVTDIFTNYNHYSGVTLYFGFIFFSYQLYCDFSGYSDIAIGTGKLFGFNLMWNFTNPFFGVNPQEFWKRWHISLSSWVSDYLYTPIIRKTRRWGIKGIYVAFIVSFTIMGLWHGANWTFVIWGLLNGLMIVIFVTGFKKLRKVKFGETHLIPSLKEFVMMFINYNLITITLVLFRSKNLTTALGYYAQLFTHIAAPIQWSKIYPFFLMIPFIIFEWIYRHQHHPLEKMSYNLPIRWIVYIILSVAVIMEMGKPIQQFIYFQF